MSIDFEAFLLHSGIERETVERWIENQWIVPSVTAAQVELSQADVARAFFVRDLVDDLGVNDQGVEVVLHLVDQLHGLRRLLVSLRAEINDRAAS